MKYIQSKQIDGEPVNLFYEDWGNGKPVVFIHGWPLDHQMWEYQTRVLTENGLRCISYDRRGFGQSDKPWNGYDYSTLASDLKALLDQLDLEDVTLVGFSMGGGEVVRYMSKYGGARVSKIVLISSIAPFMMQTSDHPDGVPQEKLEEIVTNLRDNRIDFLSQFGKQFFGVGLLNHPVSEEMLNWNLMIAMQATAKATIQCAVIFGMTDLRPEMKAINVPALVIHGDSDQTVPPKATGEQAAKMISNSKYLVYEGAPHGLYFTDRDKLNEDLMEFINS